MTDYQIAVDGFYTPVFFTSGRVSTGSVSGTKYLVVPNTVDIADNTLDQNTNTAAGAHRFGLTAARYKPYSAGTLKLLVAATVGTRGTAPGAGFVITFGLYPLTISGGLVQIGTVVASSTAANGSDLPANTYTSLASAVFTAPSDGTYGLGYIVSQTTATGSQFSVSARVEAVRVV